MSLRTNEGQWFFVGIPCCLKRVVDSGAYAMQQKKANISVDLFAPPSGLEPETP